jgi:hypothetical protein
VTGTNHKAEQFVHLPVPAAGPDVFLAALRAADWDRFRAEPHLPGLRDILVELERQHGITEAHRFATERLRTAGACLRHPDGHVGEPTASVLSPCGRYLAIGSWVGDDVDEGGALQIWELATGRCVNTFTGIAHGVGFPDCPRTIQWSADGTRIAVIHSTNVLGLWNPFGDDPGPIATAQVGDGASRPPEFALAPDGSRAYRGMRAPEGHDVHGGIVPLTEEEFFYNYEYGTDFPDWPAIALPAAVKARLGDDEVFLDWTFWSRDGERVYGYNHEWIYSIDLDRRAVSWMVEAGGWGGDGARPAWSLDERQFAVQRLGRLVFCDAMTGEPVADVPGHPTRARLSWGARGTARRLAVLVSRDRDEDSHPARVAVYDDGVHRYNLDVSIGEANADHADATAWAWAPDGRHAAAVTTQGDIEVWSLDENAERVRSIAGAHDTYGVLWGADGVLVLVGETTLRFVRAITGESIGDFAFLREPAGRRPVDTEDTIGAEIRGTIGYDPTFALDDRWGAAFANGVVVVSDHTAETLDRQLAWAVNRRFAWPARWGGLTVVPSLAAAVGLISELADFADEFEGEDIVGASDGNGAEAAVGTSDDPWPPQNTSTVDDLFDAVRAALVAVGNECTWVVDDSLRLAARLRAYRGEMAGATELIEVIRSLSQRYRATAEVALILAGEHGRIDEARVLFTATDFEIEAALGQHDLVPVGAAVGGACAVLGDTARADAWFARAVAAIEPETNKGEHRLAVIWALLACGRVGEARALWTEWPEQPLSSFSMPLLSFLARTGRDDVARELLTLRPAGASGGWFDDEWELAELLAVHGGLDLLRLWTRTHLDEDDFEYLIEGLVESGVRPGRTLPYQPTPIEITELTTTHAELLRTSRGNRQYPTEELIGLAARSGHISAVLSMLPSLKTDDYNDRASKAVSALWTVTTGMDVEPW